MRHEVKTFAQAMEHKLQKNDHKGGWEGMDFPTLFRKLRAELDELEAAIENEPQLNIIFEAADVANFAMMIGWNAMRQLVIPPQEVALIQSDNKENRYDNPPDYHSDEECGYRKTGTCYCIPF